MRVRIGDIELYYRDVGEGPPLVLAHGGPGLDGSEFFPWFERRLAGRRRLLAPDLRGNGRSDAGDPARWTIPQLAADLLAFAEALSLGEWTLLGHSFGAMVALQHVVDHPDGAARAVISAGVAHEGALATVEQELDRFEPVELREQVAASWAAEPQVTDAEGFRRIYVDQLPFHLADPQGPLVAELAAHARGIAFRPEMLRAFALEGGGFNGFDLRRRLGGVRVPVLVLTGAHDRTTSPAAAREIAGAIPGAELQLLAGAGHMAFAEQPDAYFGALEGWLARHGGAQGGPPG